jgi:hypothetical protein
MLTLEKSGLAKMHNTSSATALHTTAPRDSDNSFQQQPNRRQNNRNGHNRKGGQRGGSYSDGRSQPWQQYPPWSP